MRTKEQILIEIIKLEAEHSKLGVQINRLEKEAALLSPKKRNDKIIFKRKSDTNFTKGIISSVSFKSNASFVYYVSPCNSNWVPSKRRNFMRVETGGVNKSEILE